MVVKSRGMDVLYIFLCAMELALDVVPCLMDISVDNMFLTGEHFPAIKATMGTMIYLDCSSERLAASTLIRSPAVRADK